VAEEGAVLVDRYIQGFPEPVQVLLNELRSAIRAAAPKATEKISYRMPTFFLNGPLVYFAAYEKHIGFYPTASGIEAFKAEIAAFKNSKGAVQFPINEPLPLELIKRIVLFRLEENEKKGRR
jgi:uncharacterized protein YdhG (YjbR/CyaY superfamily)